MHIFGIPRVHRELLCMVFSHVMGFLTLIKLNHAVHYLPYTPRALQVPRKKGIFLFGSTHHKLYISAL